MGPVKSLLHRYELTAIDPFTKYLFAVQLTNVSADTIACELTSIFLDQMICLKTLLFDLGTSFVSELMQELTELLEIKMEHARLEHPKMVGVVECSHNALMRFFKWNTIEKCNDWFKYV